MVTASFKKLRMFVPNLRSASSAASSAFSMSLRRFAASDRKRESMLSASLTISAGSDSGRSGCGGEGGALSAVEPSLEEEASLGWTERERICDVKEERPAVAFEGKAAGSCLLALV